MRLSLAERIIWLMTTSVIQYTDTFKEVLININDLFLLFRILE
jgi:hypothetical protein